MYMSININKNNIIMNLQIKTTIPKEIIFF